MSERQAEILLATQNAGKMREFEDALAGALRCVAPDRALDVPETGETYFENALIKAMRFHRELGRPVLSDDSGLEVDALGGRPGVLSARYGGETATWPERWKRLNEEIRASGRPPDARFVCVLCYYDGERVPRFFQGTAPGTILTEPRGDRGFGYDPIFFSADIGKTFGEATPEEKQRVSHRAEALKNFLRWWESGRPIA